RAERAPGDELHGDVQPAVRRGTEVVDLDRVRVLELGDRSTLAVKAREHRRLARQVLVQGLDGDLAHRRAHLLLADVDDAHAAFTEHAGHSKATADELTNQRIRPARCCREPGAAASAETRALEVRVPAGFTLHRAMTLAQILPS